jgi:enoyl-CoA hydratase/carnithine racemase
MIGSSGLAQKGALMSSYDAIRYEMKHAVAIITLARPEKRNALSLDMFRELGDATEAAGGDPGVHGVVVAADGPSFCAGIDLGLLAELAPLAAKAGEDPDEFRSFVRLAQRPFLSLARMPKPTLASVQGHALGAGFQLALACDLRVAAEDVRFGLLEARYGLIPDLGGMHHLARMVGPSRAKELVWTTRSVEAEEADRLGLVNQVVAVADLPAASDALLRACLAHSAVAMALTKELIDASFERPLEEELDHEADAQAAAISGAGGGTP